jgi:hypothetical protein
MKRSAVAVSILLALSACKMKGSGAGPGAPGSPEMAVSGPESWTIDGKAVAVRKTYFLALPAEGLQYTIETPYDFGPAEQLSITQAQAEEIAYPIMKYVIANNLYRRTSLSRNGTPAIPTRIGVVLVQSAGAKSRGYKIGLSFDEIKARAGKGRRMPPNKALQRTRAQ